MKGTSAGIGNSGECFCWKDVMFSCVMFVRVDRNVSFISLNSIGYDVLFYVFFFVICCGFHEDSS